MSERKIVNIASYNRVDSLIKTLESIIDQCDVINLTLNSFDGDLHDIFYHEKVNLIFSDNSLGDAMKFYKLNESDGYYLTIDDDLIYPPNYVDFMIAKCKEYGNTKVITLHGRNFKKFPITSYYSDATERYSFLHLVRQNVKVQFGGTGVMCFHTDLLKLPIDFFRSPNMADVWIGKYCMENNIDILCVRHERGYINYVPQTSTIYDTHSKNDRIQTLVVNSIYDKTLDLNDIILGEQNNDIPFNVIDHKEKAPKIKSTIQVNQKTINYDKVNQIFNRVPVYTSVKPKEISGNSSLKTNASILQKLNKTRGRR